MKIIVTFQSKRYSVEFTNDLDSKIKLFKQRAQRAAEKEFKMCLDSLSMDHPDENGYEPVVSRRPHIPVIAPEPVTRRRRQEPEPVPEPEPASAPKPIPVPQEPYVSDWEINAKTVKNTPLFVEYDGVNKTAKDPLTGKIYDLNQYEGKLSIKFDMDHIYWYDYSTNKFAFKTYNV